MDAGEREHLLHRRIWFTYALRRRLAGRLYVPGQDQGADQLKMVLCEIEDELLKAKAPLK